MTFAKQRNRLTTYFSESSIPLVKRRTSVLSDGTINGGECRSDRKEYYQ